MNKVRLGRTNLEVGEIGAGCWAIGGPFTNMGLAGGWDATNETDGKSGLVEAVNSGATLFDTADVYGFGRSERELGWMLCELNEKAITRREDLVVCTKIGYFRGCSDHQYKPLHMRHQLEMSLENISTDYIDIYWFHNLEFGEHDKYLEAAVEQMRRFKREGLIRFIGLRGPHKFSPRRDENQSSVQDSLNRFYQIAEIIDPDVITLRFNALSHKYDSPQTDIFSWARQRNLGVITYKALAQGLLLDKYDPDNAPVFSVGDHRTRKAWFRPKALSILKQRLNIVKNEFNCKTSADLAQLFIKYNLSRSDNSCVLVGFRNPRQVRDAFSTQGRLSESQSQRLREIFTGIGEEIGKFIIT